MNRRTETINDVVGSTQNLVSRDTRELQIDDELPSDSETSCRDLGEHGFYAGRQRLRVRTAVVSQSIAIA